MEVEKGAPAVPERAVWGRQIEFILTMVGYAVGLGNVWRFPYLCYRNGGGAFLVPYVICLVFLGIPIFGLECAFGQFGGKGPITIWTFNPALKGLGYTTMFVSALIAIYYDIIIAWGLRYFFGSMTSELPWNRCDSCKCWTNDTNSTLDCSNFTGDTVSKSDVYFNDIILGKTSGIEEAGELKWDLALCNLAAWVLVFIVLSKGIQSLSKVVYFTATFPYILLTILLVRGAMLEGALEGVKFYLTPDWSRLTDASAWSDAAVQIFFSLSACQGGLVAMSSYNKFENNVLRDAIMIPIINCMTSFYAGFVVFSVLGYMAHIRGVPIANVTQGGPGLAFVVYPEALATMPVAPLWAVLFFFMVCILGFSSQFSIVETVLTGFVDEFPKFFSQGKKTIIFRGAVCLLGFVLGLPMVTQGGSYLLDLLDTYLLGFPTLFVGLLEVVAIIYIYGYSKFSADIRAMVKRPPYIYFTATWVVITPVLLVAVIVFKAYQYVPLTALGEPWWAEMLAWLVVIFTLIFIPIGFFLYTCPRGLWSLIKDVSAPEPYWLERRKLGDPPSYNDGGYPALSTTEPVPGPMPPVPPIAGVSGYIHHNEGPHGYEAPPSYADTRVETEKGETSMGVTNQAFKVDDDMVTTKF